MPRETNFSQTLRRNVESVIEILIDNPTGLDSKEQHGRKLTV